jgi:YidC/Oxa1 family membrane protein insertase
VADKNTIIGISLIAIILIAFNLMNKPSQEEIDKAKAQQEQAQTTTDNNQSDAQANFEKDSTAQNTAKKSVKHTDFSSAYMNAGGEEFILENDLIRVHINERGGRVGDVYLKKYKTYQSFAAQKDDALHFMDADNNINELIFNYKGEKIYTRNLRFEVQENSPNKIALRIAKSDDKYIEYVYSLAKDSYHLNYTINMVGFDKEVKPEDVKLHWNADLLLSEKAPKQERMVSTVFYHNEKGYQYLSEGSEDDEKTEKTANWVSFKQSYFSSILIPETPFATGSLLHIKPFDEKERKASTHVKNYQALLNLGLTNTSNASRNFQWYFGPNDYNTLKAYDKDLEYTINLGWGLFRWVNIYGIQPIFVWLLKMGIGAGLAILLLTVIIKLFLSPVTWKMYVSSAKMKILKPQIDELNAKFSKKEDAMKKQTEMMSLYKESGASPLSGCLPMLIQMPILFAVFRFFPSSFDLRQKGFLWAEDLSSYDEIFRWSAEIPVLSSIYGNHISLFTLLMAFTTLIYTHYNSANMQQPSQPGMPNMKVIMYIFPFMMIFFFNSFSSGLSYYYFISTLASILIMLGIKQFFVDEEKLKAKMAARQEASVNGKGKKKSKFQERLEALQKTQQEKLKQQKGKKK